MYMCICVYNIICIVWVCVRVLVCVRLRCVCAPRACCVYIYMNFVVCVWYEFVWYVRMV